VDHILHAGDVGPPSILLELEHVAPVTAVLGNTDSGLALRDAAAVQLDGRRFLVHHIVDPHRPSPTLAGHLRKVRPDVVVFGHTHVRFEQVVAGVLYFNPGYAGRPKAASRRTVAILHCDGHGVASEFLPLE
jgi:hypothetical protein